MEFVQKLVTLFRGFVEQTTAVALKLLLNTTQHQQGKPQDLLLIRKFMKGSRRNAAKFSKKQQIWGLNKADSRSRRAWAT